MLYTILIVFFVISYYDYAKVQTLSIPGVARSFFKEIRLSFAWENKNFIQKVGVFTYDKANKKLRITSGLCEVQNLRQPTNFEFGRGTNFAWQNSEAVVPNRISPVKYVFRYERSGVLETCVRRVKFPFPINSTAGSLYVRSTRGVQFYLARSAFKNIHQGEFFLSKAKPLLVNTLRGVPKRNYRNEHLLLINKLYILVSVYCVYGK